MWGEHGDDAKHAAVALRTARDIDAGDALPEGVYGLGRGRVVYGCGRIERGAGALEQRALVAVGDESEMPDAVEAAWQHV